MARMAKLKVIISTTGRRPIIAAPIPRPVKPSSEIGASTTRALPKRCSKPCETLNAPWYFPTSSPIRKTLASRSISSASACLSASRYMISRMHPRSADLFLGFAAGFGFPGHLQVLACGVGGPLTLNAQGSFPRAHVRLDRLDHGIRPKLVLGRLGRLVGELDRLVDHLLPLGVDRFQVLVGGRLGAHQVI